VLRVDPGAELAVLAASLAQPIRPQTRRDRVRHVGLREDAVEATALVDPRQRGAQIVERDDPDDPALRIDHREMPDPVVDHRVEGGEGRGPELDRDRAAGRPLLPVHGRRASSRAARVRATCRPRKGRGPPGAALALGLGRYVSVCGVPSRGQIGEEMRARRRPSRPR
jgi:hypothetical protein